MRPAEPPTTTHPEHRERYRLVGSSEATNALRLQIDVAARYDEPVLIVGETGVGKEVVARAIHRRSCRSGLPLQIINCAGMAADVLGSELFGHRAGAFTGATRNRRGRLRAAHGSTVLLDEVTETDAAFQTAVLRAVETGEVQPLGEDTVYHTDVRFLATSNRPLEQLSDPGVVRQDLLHRIAGLVIEIPPLRQRPTEIPELCTHFLERLRQRYGTARTLTAGASDLLLQHSYPGNVRELSRIITRAYAHSPDEYIEPAAVSAAISRWLLAAPPDTGQRNVGEDRDLSLQGVIRAHIRRTIALADRNLSEAARLLEIPRSTLQHYLSKYQIEQPGRGTRPRTRARGG